MTQTTIRPSDILPVHDAFDTDKVSELVASMTANGWTGAPIVVAGDQALTGSHRLAAAEQAEIDVPTVEIADLMAEHGHSWTELVEGFETAGVEMAWYDAARYLGEYLPADVIEFYGLDIH